MIRLMAASPGRRSCRTSANPVLKGVIYRGRLDIERATGQRTTQLGPPMSGNVR